MANTNKNIEQVFKTGFENFEHQVSERVWEHIDQELFHATLNNTKGYSVYKMLLLAIIPFSIITTVVMLIPVKEEVIKEEIVYNVGKVSEIENDGESYTQYSTLDVEKDNDSKRENSSENQVLIIEENDGTEIEETYKDEKEVKSKEKDDYTPKEMPNLADKPYINYTYFKDRSAESYANFSITKLNKGVLLVRLKTREKSINALKKMGQHKKARKLQQEVFEDNLNVVNAFKINYNFSEVYFFYSTESDKIRNMTFDEVFVDAKTLEKSDKIKLDPSQTFYMILDIGALKIPNIEGEFHQQTALDRVLVVKDRDFEQLYRPFPFYVGASNKNNIDAQVKRLNNNLWNYHEKNKGNY